MMVQAWYQKIEKDELRKILLPYIHSACSQNLAKSFCGSLPLWLRHKIDPPRKKKKE